MLLSVTGALPLKQGREMTRQHPEGAYGGEGEGEGECMCAKHRNEDYKCLSAESSKE
jgi:hypothetical protein